MKTHHSALNRIDRLLKQELGGESSCGRRVRMHSAIIRICPGARARTRTHTRTEMELIYMQSCTRAKLLNQFKSAACSFPRSNPSRPLHTWTPEYFTNAPITTSLPVAILIHYDGFILAIFSICPLAFFALPTDGGNFSVTFNV